MHNSGLDQRPLHTRATLIGWKQESNMYDKYHVFLYTKNTY